MNNKLFTVAYQIVDEKVIFSMNNILDTFRRCKHGSHFFEQTDYIKQLIPQYIDIIGKYMDIQLLRVNLNSLQYMFLYEFLKDAYIMFENCRIYNQHVNDAQMVQLANDGQKNLIDSITNQLNYNFKNQEYCSQDLLTIINYNGFNVDQGKYQMLSKQISYQHIIKYFNDLQTTQQAKLLELLKSWNVDNFCFENSKQFKQFCRNVCMYKFGLIQ